MNSEVEITEVDAKGRIILPEKIRDKIGIHPHDKLVLGIKNNTLILTKQKRSVFDLQLKEVKKGTLKKALLFERSIDKAGKKDMPVQE
ncbi:MAG: AbrB/MazE/SpoVT family DNA-binding domain-containing protein [Candidatus Methanoperedens sp.]|nr:AbrB/MazE/SpoVT family DNA-binding domain-containing protein [Candidatus Methanoperedens sp.]